LAEARAIGVPSVRGMRGAFTAFAIGAGGGLVYALSTAFFGTGLMGALAAPVLAGSVVKGNRGTALATIAGFLLLSGVGSAGGSAQAASSSNNVM